MNKKYKNTQDKDTKVNLVLGIGVGTIIGVSISHIVLGMTIGVIVGFCIGTLSDGLNNNIEIKNQSDNKELPFK